MTRGILKQAQFLLALLALSAIVYIAFPDEKKPDEPGLGGFYQVMQVFDGDTISILVNTERVTVRLIGIDSPEVDTPYTKPECFGTEATLAARDLMNNKLVRIETDSTQDTYDKYHRLLAYVYVPTDTEPGGISANEYMLKGGYAREYTYKKPYRYQAQFKADAAVAQGAQKGLWGACSSS